MKTGPAPPAAVMAMQTHRLWPAPARPWVMAQSWQKLLFAHWPLQPALLRPLLPPGLVLDTFDGEAWVGVVPFLMNHVRFRRLPPVPGTVRFPELNLRTYVRVGERPGVWFFSLDAARWPPVLVARRTFHLPYYKARMQMRVAGPLVRYSSQRTHPGAIPAQFAAHYSPSAPVFRSQPGSLAHWLTERYCLYAADRAGRLYRGEIQHRPWPLQLAEGAITHNTLALAAGLRLPDVPPLLHYTENIDVLAWSLRRLKRA